MGRNVRKFRGCLGTPHLEYLPRNVHVHSCTLGMVQQEDGGPWTHRTIEGQGNQNYHDRSYHIHITKTDRLVT